MKRIMAHSFALFIIMVLLVPKLDAADSTPAAASGATKAGTPAGSTTAPKTTTKAGVEGLVSTPLTLLIAGAANFMAMRLLK